MIEVLRQQFKPDMSNEEKINRVREALQLTVLKILYDKGYFSRIAFVGGTALRVLFDLRRFSEDLDFSLVQKKGYYFPELIAQVAHELGLYGLTAQARAKEEKTVQSSFLRFAGLLKQLGLSNLEDQKLSIKIEVDSNPPAGWQLETSLVNKMYMLNLTHFDLSSLYATKLHACFYRKYIKGRDFYDLVWYIGKKVRPNYALLNNAIKQTQGHAPQVREDNFSEFLLEKIKNLDFVLIRKDVERLIEDKNELRLLNPETIKNSLRTAFAE